MPSSTRSDDSIIFIATRFHSLARRPGGIPREEAIETAVAHLGEMQPDFSKWLDEELTLLIQAIPADISEVSAGDPWLDAAYPHCRAVRDVGATMGFDLITFAANNLCEIIEVVRAGVECPIDAIESQVQALLLARREADRTLHARLPRGSSEGRGKSKKPAMPGGGRTPPKRT